MKKFDTRVYSISDFLEWQKSNILDLSPEFQRRGVWTRVAKSYLIDTIIRGKPIPKLLITQNLSDQRNIRTVVDGQQRLRTIFEFINNDFTILRAHNDMYARKTFESLDEDIKLDILKYEIGVDVLFDVNYTDLLDIFGRINTYSVTLNSQEKLNAKYLGAFKTYAYELGRNYVDYFVTANIFTKKQISRMFEAELSSNLLIALCDSIQSGKNIEKFYRKYENIEDIPEELRIARDNFNIVMSYIGAIYDAGDLKNTNWSRPQLFYTLFIVIAHALFGVKGLPNEIRPELSENLIGRWRIALDDVSANYDNYTSKNALNVPQDYIEFIDYSRRRTTDELARIKRVEFLLNKLP
ncbi:MAG: DUF262 domain-containing protein [Deltaproteobacteria bacterium]|nr:DUF262 domain-containing protein [Deltaproteobacteria bacterium]